MKDDKVNRYNGLVAFWNKAAISNHPFTPDEKNAHLRELHDKKIKVKSWEKGFVKQIKLAL